MHSHRLPCSPAPAAMAGRQPIDPSKLVSARVDGMTGDIPVIAYTEQVLEEKQAVLRRYISENYSKIQSVEKELASLTLEVKQTSGARRAALELLRKKIEQSAERIRAARTREGQAKKAWEEAAKAVEHEEGLKQKLCDDLNLMVHENAMIQYERLEELTRKLDALNPEMAGGALQTLEDLRATIAPHGAPVLEGQDLDPAAAVTTRSMPAGAPPIEVNGGGTCESGEGGATEVAAAANGLDPAPPAQTLQPAKPQRRVELSPAGAPRQVGTPTRMPRGRGRGPMTLKSKRADGQENSWTGSGFDVQDGGE